MAETLNEDILTLHYPIAHWFSMKRNGGCRSQKFRRKGCRRKQWRNCINAGNVAIKSSKLLHQSITMFFRKWKFLKFTWRHYPRYIQRFQLSSTILLSSFQMFNSPIISECESLFRGNSSSLYNNYTILAGILNWLPGNVVGMHNSSNSKQNRSSDAHLDRKKLKKPWKREAIMDR